MVAAALGAPQAAASGLDAREAAAFADYNARRAAVARAGIPVPVFEILGDPRLQRPIRTPAAAAAAKPQLLPDPPRWEPARAARPPAPAATGSIAVAHARRIDDLIRKVGIDPARVLSHPALKVYGQGGPFVPLNRSQVSLLQGGHGVVGGLASRPDRLQLLVRQLPLTAPVKETAVSSSFGARRDPFTDSWAFHGGLDMPGPVNAPVLGTAPGTVVFAGWHDSYGRMVEVEHDLGISTRYAHLASLAVRRGQRVQAGQRIGGLGSTGRSTGPHLHYEVLVDGRQVDPQPFLDTGRDIHGN